MVAKYDKTWPVDKALWLTFVAKARAEMAGGVGNQTDMVIVAAGRRHVFTEAQKETLKKMFEDASKKEAAVADEVVAEIRKFIEAEAAKEKASADASQTDAPSLSGTQEEKEKNHGKERPKRGVSS